MSVDSDLNKLAIKILPSYNHLLESIKPILAYCDNAHLNKAVIRGIFEDFALYYQCTEHGCGQIWIVCCKCDKQRVKLRSRKAVWAHNQQVHKQNNKRKSHDKGAENPTFKRIDSEESPGDMEASFDNNIHKVGFGNVDKKS